MFGWFRRKKTAAENVDSYTRAQRIVEFDAGPKAGVTEPPHFITLRLSQQEADELVERWKRAHGEARR